jgi:hypothetical protein
MVTPPLFLKPQPLWKPLWLWRLWLKGLVQSFAPKSIAGTWHVCSV